MEGIFPWLEWYSDETNRTVYRKHKITNPSNISAYVAVAEIAKKANSAVLFLRKIQFQWPNSNPHHTQIGRVTEFRAGFQIKK
jgi:hypothetical protein